MKEKVVKARVRQKKKEEEEEKAGGQQEHKGPLVSWKLGALIE